MRSQASISIPLRPLEVLLIAPSMAGFGGQSIQAELLVRKMKNHPAMRISFLPIDPAFPVFLKSLRKIRFARTVINQALFLPQLYLAIRKCDIVHVFSASYFSFLLAPTPAILLARIFRKPVVLNYHSGEAQDHLARWPFAVRTLRMVDRLVVPSDYLAEVFARFGLVTRTVFNAVDLSVFRLRVRERPAPRFLCNRNFEAHYDVACVLRAFALVQASMPDAELTLAGTGPEEGRLRQLAADLALQNVSFAGRVDPKDMPTFYDKHDIWLNGSFVDNMPLSILEAYASGLAVISTSAGGIPYMVRNEETGRLVPCGDYQALAKASISLLGDSAAFRRLTAAGAAECQRYAWGRIGPAWESVYRSVAPSGTLIERQSAETQAG